MQNINWQLVVTFLLIAIAAGYALRRLYNFFIRKAGCATGGCNGCGSQETTSLPDNFVPIETLTQKPE